MYQVGSIVANVTNGLVIADNLAFRTTKKLELKECNISIYETTEGIYLSDESLAERIEKSDLEYKDNLHLLLGDLDSKSLKLMNLFAKWSSDSNDFTCNVLKSLINIIEKIVEQFFVIDDAEGYEIIFYNYYGEIVMAKCVRIDDLKIQNNTTN